MHSFKVQQDRPLAHSQKVVTRQSPKLSCPVAPVLRSSAFTFLVTRGTRHSCDDTKRARTFLEPHAASAHGSPYAVTHVHTCHCVRVCCVELINHARAVRTEMMIAPATGCYVKAIALV